MRVEACNVVADSKLLADQDGKPIERVHGIETEYALNLKPNPEFFGADMSPRYQQFALGEAARIGFNRFGTYKNIFLADGDREYVDIGYHPEISTAEDPSFEGTAFRVARGHVKVGARYGDETLDMLNVRLIEETKSLSAPPIIGLDVFANNREPNGIDSWSSHLNLLARNKLELDDYVYAFIAHNVSQIAWSGTGAVLPGDKSGSFRYGLSERADFLRVIIGSDAVRSRPLVHHKDVPYADPNIWRRIHDVSGETAMNPYVNAMRAATKSIILRACELGADFSDLVPVDPLAAIRAFSNDPSLQVKVLLENDRYFSALDIQEAVAVRSRRIAYDHDYLTPQEKSWCIKWLSLIKDLRRDTASCRTRVDWIMKREYIERGLERQLQPDQTDFNVAWSRALSYQSVAREGLGMRLLRNGYYALSPTEEMLDEGLPLPDSRAKLRGGAIQQLNDSGVRHTDNWDRLKLSDYRKSAIELPHPIISESEEFETFLGRLAA